MNYTHSKPSGQTNYITKSIEINKALMIRKSFPAPQTIGSRIPKQQDQPHTRKKLDSKTNSTRSLFKNFMSIDFDQQ